MRVLVLTSTKHSLPTVSELLQRGLLSAILVPERDEEEVNTIKAWSAAQQMPAVSCNREDFAATLQRILAASEFDMAIVFGFPWKIPQSLLSLPSHGFFNVHFSVLPAYRGPMPVFWQLRNGEKQTGVTIHRMDNGFDTGDIACTVSLPMLPGETMGLCSARLAQASVNLVGRLLEATANGSLQLVQQDETKASCHTRPGNEALEINWSKHDSNEIQQIVHACNPMFHGALTRFNGMPLRILEVSPADAPDYPGYEAGTIVHADINHGIFVICKDRKTIRLLVVQIPEGIISGGKLSALGVGVGARFGNTG
jgi:methionyl-tRNA formyltransferase